jgi:hypothetical protein
MISFNLPSSAVRKHKKGFAWSGRGGNAHWSYKLLEMLVFASAVPLIGHFFFSIDPVGMNGGFPWFILPPVIFAARYGAAWGFCCAALAAAALAYPFAAYAGQQTQLIALAVGTVVLSIIVGDFATRGKRDGAQQSAENHYLRHRLKEFSKDYHILKVSHGQLEEYMAGKRLSVRQALQQLKPLMSAGNGEDLTAGPELMAIFAQFGAVQVAGLYGMKTRNRINPQPVATHGDMPELSLFDPLLKLAMESRQLVSVKLEAQANETVESKLLAVVPIVDSHDQLHGVLAIKDMHFMAFQQENLNVLSLLGSYVGDMVTRSRSVGESRSGWFMAELDNALRFANTNRVVSTLLAVRLKSTDQTQIVADFLGTNIRSLDSSWQPQSPSGETSVMILMPLMNEKQCRAYLERVAKKLFDEHKIELNNVTEEARMKQIRKKDNRDSCMAFINQIVGVKREDDKPKKRRWGKRVA